MSDLRTQIATAIYTDNIFGWSMYMCEEAADNVISGLKIQYEYENGRVVYTTKPAACKANGHWTVRIVSPPKLYEGEE